MPLIIITGIPSSGKTRRMSEIKAYFEVAHKKIVHVVSENDIIKNSGRTKNEVAMDSSKEKEIRGLLKADAQRSIGRDNIVILDGGNYIKGYRYELYCMSKASKTTQCTVHCNLPTETARSWNEARQQEEWYTDEVFDALTMRYEAPDDRNRWDSPLFTFLPDTSLPGQDMFGVLYERKAPPPNQSTQCAPLSSTNFLYELDRITQEIVTAILASQKLGLDGEIRIPGYDCILQVGGTTLTAPQLTRLRRQFLAYTKMHPSSEAAKIGPLFVQFLNTSLS